MATLTTVHGANATLRDQTLPSVKLASQQNYGKLRVLYDSYTVDAADEFGTDGLVNLMKVPRGARVIDMHVVMPASGATGIFDLGWAAGSGSGDTEAADANGFGAHDPGNAALDARMDGTEPGYQKTFTQEVQIQADWTEISADAGGDKLEVTLVIAVE